MNIKKLCSAGALSMVIATSGQPAVHAASSVSQSMPFTTNTVVDWCGDFNMRVQETGTLQIVRSRSGITLTNWRVQVSAENLTSGKILHGREQGPSVEEIGNDGATTVIFLGHLKFTAPGQGVVVQKAGRHVTVIPADPGQPVQVVFDAGPNDDVVAGVCTYLRSS
jgi:hypothetical protein